MKSPIHPTPKQENSTGYDAEDDFTWRVLNMGLGMWMEINWGLWKGKELVD